MFLKFHRFIIKKIMLLFKKKKFNVLKLKIIIFLILNFLIKNVVAQKFEFKIYDENQNLIQQTKNFDFNQVGLVVKNKILKFRQNGFLEATYDSVVYDNNQIIAYFFVGQKYKFGNIVFEGVSENVLQKIGINYKKYYQKPLNFEFILDLNQKIISYYENSGYPFVSINYDSVYVANNQLDYKLKIDKHNLYKIDSIFVLSEAKYSINFITNFIDIKNGSIYNQQKISEIDSKINEIDFLQTLRPSEVEFHKQDAQLFIYLSKRKANIFDGIIGFLPDSKNSQKLKITGDINLKLINSINMGETLVFNWQKYDNLSQNLEVNFSFPYLFGKPFGLNETFFLEKQDTTFLTINNIAGLQYFIDGANYVEFYLSTTKSVILNQTLLTNSLFSNINTNIYGVSFFNQKFDYKYNPSKGYLINLKSGYGLKKMKDSVDSKQIELEFKTQLFIPIPSKFTFLIQNQSKLLYNKTAIYENELYKIGGFRTIRGFAEKSILANRYSIVTCELRYLFEKKSNIYLFADFGYFAKNLKLPNKNQFTQSFGTGINFSTKNGIFSMNYALGRNTENIFIIQNAKIHFGFISLF